MIIEREESVILEDGVHLADDLVGGLWVEFRNSIPAPQAKELGDAFNLIMVSNGESLLASQIAAALNDEARSVSEKKQLVYVVITTNIIDLLQKLGFVLNDDVAGEDKLEHLYKLADFFFELEEYEDLIGLKGLLESYDIPPINRFLRAVEIYWGEDFDISEFEMLLVDVSEVTIKAIKDALFNPDDVETAPLPIQERILANRKLLENTLAYTHVTKNGQLGGSVASFLKFYSSELHDIREAREIEQYTRELIGFFLISEINNEHLKDQLSKYVYSVVHDPVTLIKVEALMDEVVIP